MGSEYISRSTRPRQTNTAIYDCLNLVPERFRAQHLSLINVASDRFKVIVVYSVSK